MSDVALLTHYRRIADESRIPIVLYNIPKYTHFALAPAVVGALAQHANVIGIKDSSGDLSLLSTYLAFQSSSFSVLTGNGSTFADALERGVRGSILAVALFAAQLSLEVFDAFLAGDGEAARRAQTRLTPLAQHIVGGLQVPGVKAALDRLGLAGGEPRLPLLPLGPAEVARVDELLRAAELAPAS
jgi:dihydrodipicolinate synthase/N-acetylneuraminate lyase